jgi:L,D-transpeptidase catalytic domain
VNFKNILLTLIFFSFLTFDANSKSPITVENNLFFVVENDVKIKEYFHFIDSICQFLDAFVPYSLDEHLLVRHNKWLINAFQNTDYYRIKSEGISVYDQSNLVILHSGDTLFIPNEEEAKTLLDARKNTVIDVNIPEFRLRILDNGEIIESIPIRVGQNGRRFMAAVGKEVDMRTHTGKGEIAVLHRDIVHIDPVSADTFFHTKRDDGVTTRFPVIPWIEPRINKQLYGQWIHPTTNPRTLEKAYSNGCMGMREADAWLVYFYAPVGTPIQIRYDLKVEDKNGNIIKFEDIYGIEAGK